MSDDAVHQALEEAHRRFFGRLVGWLFRMTGDLQLAEDAVASAFASAVSAWRQVVPASPEAWLRVASRNQAMSALRRESRTRSVPNEAFDDWEAATPAEPRDRSTADDRLGLLFVCAHPSIDATMHAPLMLQAVFGVDAARIASMFLTPPTTMGQRLSRAKAKIRDAGIRFRVPEGDELPGRLTAVLNAVYAAYGLADPIAQLAAEKDAALRGEAIRLARLLTEALPDQAETWGLLALLLHTESRRDGRIAQGRFVPLAHQDVGRWSASLRAEADAALARASRSSTPVVLGRFQIEAAISSLHSQRADRGVTEWTAISTLYRGLLAVAPSAGAVVGAASALTEAGDAESAIALLDGLDPTTVRDYQPYWVCRAHVLEALDRTGEARSSRERAIGLTSNPLVRDYLVTAQQARAEGPIEPGSAAT